LEEFNLKVLNFDVPKVPSEWKGTIYAVISVSRMWLQLFNSAGGAQAKH